MSDPKAPQAHDILLIPPLKPRVVEAIEEKADEAGPTGVLQMSVQEDGRYAGSRVLDVHDEGARKIYNIARPDDEKRYGPGFSVLPIRPDPGSQSATCFLINTENLILPNPWTAADWDVLDIQGEGQPSPNVRQAEPERVRQWCALEDDLRLLVAGPKGKVYLVKFPKDGPPPEAGEVKEITDLKTQVSVWSQLREGLIVGTAMFKERAEEEERALPLFNVTSVNVKKGEGS